MARTHALPCRPPCETCKAASPLAWVNRCVPTGTPHCLEIDMTLDRRSFNRNIAATLGLGLVGQAARA